MTRKNALLHAKKTQANGVFPQADGANAQSDGAFASEFVHFACVFFVERPQTSRFLKKTEQMPKETHRSIEHLMKGLTR